MHDFQDSMAHNMSVFQQGQGVTMAHPILEIG